MVGDGLDQAAVAAGAPGERASREAAAPAGAAAAAPGAATAPGAAAAPAGAAPRRPKTSRDMIITMAIVLVVVGLIALYGSRIAFSPGAQPVTGPVPTADVIGGFTHAKGTLPFPVTVPRDLPESWHPNSLTVSTPVVDGPGVLPTVRGGWVTPEGAFITLIESSGNPDQVLVAEIGSTGSSKGTTQAGGATWSVTTGRRGEAAWIRNGDGATYLITGNATPAEFTTLAEAVASPG